MNYSSVILFCLTIVLLISCKTDRSSSNKTRTSYQDIWLLAWNEDTVHSYRFAMTKNRKFLYTIIKNDSVKTTEYYHGTFLNQLSVDTIFLKYDRNIRPGGATNYMIREVSGQYLIQPFENNVTRIFLRIQRLEHRF
jgi:hypothetical protein